jgi:hypothetical protein
LTKKESKEDDLAMTRITRREIGNAGQEARQHGIFRACGPVTWDLELQFRSGCSLNRTHSFVASRPSNRDFNTGNKKELRLKVLLSCGCLIEI